MTLPGGTDFIDGSIYSFQQANRMKNNWYSEDPRAADMQNGMMYVSEVNGAVYVKALGIITPLGDLPVTDKVADYTIVVTDLNSVLTMTSGGAQTFTLPSIDANHIGKFLIVTKLGAGSVIIARADADTINGGTQVANPIDDEFYSSICLRIIGATTWAIEWAMNPFSWIVT